jgi:hypothetical protein
MASGAYLYFSSHLLAISPAALAEDTMGTSFVSLDPFKNEGRLSGSPAPEKIISIPSSIAVLAMSEKFDKATIILIPRIPLVSSRAFLISFLRALIFASI